MTSQEKTSPRSREAFLAVVMFAVLLAAVGGALWLVRCRTDIPMKRGAEIAGELRANGLAHYWGRKTVSASYIVIDETGRRLGRMGSARRLQAKSDRFEGVVEERSPDAYSKEIWVLDDKLNYCDYNGTGGALLTRTTLEAGRVKITQRRGLEQVKAEAPAPDNFLPDGTVELAARLVAAAGKRAAFKVIIDSAAILQGEVNFTTLSMVPVSAREIKLHYTTPKGSITKVYTLDGQGEVKEINLPRAGIRYVRDRIQAEPAENGSRAQPPA